MRKLGSGKKLIEEQKINISLAALKEYRDLSISHTRSTTGVIDWETRGTDDEVRFVLDTSIPEPYIRLSYIRRETYDGPAEQFAYSIPLTKSRRHFGGYKWSFICENPVGGCKRNTQTLYLNGNYFMCSTCAQLTYKVSNEKKSWRNSEFKKAVYNVLKAEQLLETIKKKYYLGRPTRKYRKYLKLMRNKTPEEAYDDFNRSMEELEKELEGNNELQPHK